MPVAKDLHNQFPSWVITSSSPSGQPDRFFTVFFLTPSLIVLLAKIHESFSDIRGKRMLVKIKPKYIIFEIAQTNFAAKNWFCSNKAPATWVAPKNTNSLLNFVTEYNNTACTCTLYTHNMCLSKILSCNLFRLRWNSIFLLFFASFIISSLKVWEIQRDGCDVWLMMRGEGSW